MRILRMLHILNHARNPARYFHKKFPDREIAEIYAKKIYPTMKKFHQSRRSNLSACETAG